MNFSPPIVLSACCVRQIYNRGGVRYAHGERPDDGGAAEGDDDGGKWWCSLVPVLAEAGGGAFLSEAVVTTADKPICLLVLA